MCFNCLKSGHHSKHCRSHNRCITCHGKHHNAICFSSTNQGNDRKSPRDPGQVAKPEVCKKLENTEAVPIAMICNSAASVLMQSGRALVSTTNGNHYENVRVIFDSGSQRSFVTNELKNALGLHSIGKRSLRVIRFMDRENSSDHAVARDCDLVQFLVKGLDGTDIIVTACSIPQICPPPNSHQVKVCKERFEHLQNLVLSDEKVEVPFRGDCIDILIGLDYYWAFILGEVKRGGSGPVALESRVGWLLSGPIIEGNTVGDCDSQSMLILNQEDDRLDLLAEKFWSLETIGVVESKNSDVMKRFSDTVVFKENSGRYQVNLPWRENMGVLSDNYSLCHKRLTNQLKRFCHDSELFERYNSVMADHIVQGILEPVKATPPEVGRAYYLPHHGVLREDHETTKLRVVYDGSSSACGPSLNQMLHEGPCLLPELLKVLMRFRCRKYAFTADVQQAFLQVEIAAKDRDFLRTLWVPGFNPRSPNPSSFKIEEFRFTRCVFGVTSSPFHLLATFRHHLAKYSKHSFQEVEEILRSLYVDD